jgi:hypothetical protein
MNAVSWLIHKHRNRRVRTGIRNMLRHFLHDEFIANQQTDDLGDIKLLGSSQAEPLYLDFSYQVESPA